MSLRCWAGAVARWFFRFLFSAASDTASHITDAQQRGLALPRSQQRNPLFEQRLWANHVASAAHALVVEVQTASLYEPSSLA